MDEGKLCGKDSHLVHKASTKVILASKVVLETMTRGEVTLALIVIQLTFSTSQSWKKITAPKIFINTKGKWAQMLSLPELKRNLPDRSKVSLEILKVI
jgi:hypothetical protein